MDKIVLKKGSIEKAHYYGKDELLDVLPINEDTLRFWIEDGLGFVVTGPDQFLIDGEVLIQFLKDRTVIRKKIMEDDQ